MTAGNEDHRTSEERSSAANAVASEGAAPLSLSSIPNLVALVGAISVTLSLSRQLGFYLFSDPDLMAFMSLQDIISNSLHYIPLSILAVLFNIGVQSYNVRFEAGEKTIGLINWLFKPSPREGVFVAVLLVVVLVFFTTDWPHYAMWFSFLLLGDFAAWARKVGFGDRVPQLGAYIVGLFVALNLFLAGASEAIHLETRQPDYVVYTTAGETLDVVFLRKTQEFLLFRSASGALLNIPNSQVASIRQIEKRIHAPLISIPFGDVTFAEVWGSISRWFIDLFPRPQAVE